MRIPEEAVCTNLGYPMKWVLLAEYRLAGSLPSGAERYTGKPANFSKTHGNEGRAVMKTRLEHINLNVSDAKATAARLSKLFGWHIRWEGPASEGYTVHVGTDADYLALYSPQNGKGDQVRRYHDTGALNHIGIVVDDLDAARKRIEAEGYRPYSFAEYEPGRRFYFIDKADNIEYEVVNYDRS